MAGAASAPWIGAYGVLVGADMWMVVSAVIYLSALGDPHGRGWHDKAAGTIVIEAPRPYRSAQGPEIPQKWQGWRDVPFS